MLFIIYYQNLKANFSLQKNLKKLSSLFTHSSKKKKEKRKKKQNIIIHKPIFLVVHKLKKISP
jgi:hypothetical protein